MFDVNNSIKESPIRGLLGMRGGIGLGFAGPSGFTIDQSLRFEGSGRLVSGNTQPTGNYTFACWFKRGDESFGTDLKSILSFTGNQTYQIAEPARGDQGLVVRDGGTVRDLANGDMPDYSAWYHICVTVTSGTCTCYINGVRTSNTSSQPSGGSDMTIGSNSPSLQDDALLGYLAEFNLLDGTVVGGTTVGDQVILDEFGELNSDGIWVPKAVDGVFTAAQYGAKGFRLTFDSTQTNAGVGEDSAPIGASGHTSRNDFTVTGFDTADVALYTGREAGSTSTYESNPASRTQALINAGSTFDGNTAGGTQVNGGGGGYWYLEDQSFIGLTGMRLMWPDVSQVADIRLNGTSVSFTTSGSFTVVDTSDIPATVTEIAARRNTDNTQVLQVEVNTGSGFEALLDNTSNDVDYLDTPTSNFAIQDSSYARRHALWSRPVLTEANLKSTGNTTNTGQDEYVLSTVGITTTDSNTYYFEFIVDDLGGTTSPNYPAASVKYDKGGGTGADNKFYLSCDGTAVSEGSSLSAGPTFNTVGDVVGLTWNASTGTVTVAVNGGTATTWNLSAPDSETFLTSVNLDDNGNSGKSATTNNYGQHPFLRSPNGIKKLQTNNIPRPTIKDGKKYFDVRQYTSAATAADLTVNDLEFEPDLIWFKSRSNGSGWETADVVRGTNNLMGIDDNGTQSTTANTCKAFGTNGSINGFTLGTGQSNINFNSRTYTAYCWKAGGATVTNNDGSIESQVSANTTAGFSVVGYTGNNQTVATVGHGLNKAPNCIIVKDRNDTTNWVVYHTGIDATAPEDFGTIFDTASVASDNSAFWNDTAPTDSVFTIGTNADVNPNDTNSAIAWCWHDVTGFQKFGTFTGNGDTDGTFVYLGFKPAFVIIKKTFGGNEWHSWDSTANPANPVRNCLLTSGADTQDTIGRIYFMANGFKLNTTNTVMNHDNLNYIYMAWAEHPSGGKNTAPNTGAL